MTINKDGNWVFDVWIACSFGYGVALMANNIWGVWEMIESIIFNLIIATSLGMLYGYVLRHWKQ